MKILFIVFGLAFFSVQTFARLNAVYEVTIVNLTKGQPITPPVLLVHTKGSKIFELGEKASPGLVELAEDGKTAALVSELKENSNNKKVVVGDGLIFPGQSQTFRIQGQRWLYLSLVGMLAKTNDAFIAKQFIRLNLLRGMSKTYLLKVYDAGSEINNELADYIPAFGNVGVRTQENEGFVHPHPGIFGIADLDVITDAFAAEAAKIMIKRIR